MVLKILQDRSKYYMDFAKYFAYYELIYPVTGVLKHISKRDFKNGSILKAVGSQGLGISNSTIKEVDGSCTVQPNCLWLANHRSIIDFAMLAKILPLRAAVLSRKEVENFFPLWRMFNIKALCNFEQLWFFDRNAFTNNHADDNKTKTNMFDELYIWLDEKFAKNDVGLALFPEGTRNIGDKPLKLKKGLLKYAYTRNKQVQIIITKGTDDVFSLKKKRSNHNVIIQYYADDVLDPSNFETFMQFYRKVSDNFNKIHDQLYCS